MSRLDTHVILTEGVFADLPDLTDPLVASLYPIGALFSATDVSIIYRRDEDVTWHAWATLAGVLPDPSGEPDGEVLQTSSGSAIWAADPGGGGLVIGYVNLQDQKTTGTDGGTFTSGAWRTRTLNTEQADTNGDCSLASDQFTLAAGTYIIQATAPAYHVDSHKTRLRNVTDATTLMIGTIGYCNSTYNPSDTSRLTGVFTIGASKALEVQHQCTTTTATNGFGVGAGFSEIEIYTVVELWRIA